MVYSEVYNMMNAPGDYIGKTIKMTGQFVYYENPDTKAQYFTCIIGDAMACCSQGLEFVLTGKHTYPDDYASIKQPRIIQANMFGKLEIISATDVLKDDSFTNESGYVLLTFLLLNRKREHPLRLLTDVIWESTDMENPYNSIKNVVYRLRSTLACIGIRDLIQASHGTFTLNPNYTIFTDVERFDDACKRIDNSSDPAILQALYESIIGLYRGSLLPRYDFYHWLMPKTLYYQNKFLHYMKRYLSMLYREKNYLRVQELSMDLLSIDMYESEVHYYLIKAMFMSGSKTLSQIYFRQAEPYLTDEHMQELKTFFT